METPMFCYQCEQTSLGTGCVEFGICGKDADVAVLQDLLIYQIEGLAVYGAAALAKGQIIPQEIHRLVIDALFSTLTNVNFDAKFFLDLLKRNRKIKNHLEISGRDHSWEAACRGCLPAPRHG